MENINKKIEHLGKEVENLEYDTERHSKYNAQFWHDQLYNAANNIYAETYTESELVTLYQVCDWLKEFFNLKEYKNELDKKRI